jgi:hypothetical protein
MGESGDRRRLEAVLAEQARLSDGFRRAIGTSDEQAAYFRLKAANARVTKFDRIARGLAQPKR